MQVAGGFEQRHPGRGDTQRRCRQQEVRIAELQAKWREARRKPPGRIANDDLETQTSAQQR